MQAPGKTYLRIALITALLLCPLILSRGAESARSNNKPRWRYIVIHHSATRKGNAHIMDRYHKKRMHMKNGLAYHFVIDNGTCGRKDGQVERGRRWKNQLSGGHVKQGWLNNCGIGICLVGNFDRSYVTKKQFESLVKLVDKLRKTYSIPLSCIKGHKDFNGERTVCPGKKFPMAKLKRRLKEMS